MGKTFWMLVTTQENLDITRSRGFSIQGVDTKNRKKAVRMGPQDRVLYYVSDKKGFAATATVTSDSFEDEERIWKHHREKEVFPHRVELNADVVLDEPDYIDGFQVGPTLEYVKKWPPHLWSHAFFGMLHIIPQRDFYFVEAELRRAGGIAPPPPVIEAPVDTQVVAVAVANSVEVSSGFTTGYSQSLNKARKKFLALARTRRKRSNCRRVLQRR
ncbi:MAG: EVE domain-containing protein [Chloroflexi bacterium]|jgi:hypothetical protein|nr:EVE domain-containing protein [Chloroflexota bacterium]MBT3862414.1 EVE domain-containing protein [Chloroflexota bacterium]MBT4141937.1 EVE domain-containing protein [Chloroflexota bacterium]MBT4341634.1 EVE domain-containing protein [Chloroflexota bacterium]MBT4942821.1 EVE domain-containing protein [Chloroflexota bacterium]